MKAETYLLNKRKEYYNKTYVLFELVKTMKNREVVFISQKYNEKCIRGLCIKSVDYLKKVFEMFDFYNMDYSIYISNAQYSTIPQFTYNLRDRSKDTIKWFRENQNDVIEYDLFLDFDAKQKENFLDMFLELKYFTRLLDREKIKYYIMPSGSGFHIIIPSEIIKLNSDYYNTDLQDINSRNALIGRIIKNIKIILELKYLDLIGSGTLAKLRKCPYSLVYDKVCLPLENLENFKYYSMDSNNVLNDVFLKERGLKYRNSNVKTSKEEEEKYFKKFMSKYYLLLK